MDVISRPATIEDAALLSLWNQQLIRDYCITMEQSLDAAREK